MCIYPLGIELGLPWVSRPARKGSRLALVPRPATYGYRLALYVDLLGMDLGLLKVPTSTRNCSIPALYT